MTRPSGAADFRPAIRYVHGTVQGLVLHRGLCPSGILSLNGVRGSASQITEWITGTLKTEDHFIVIDSDIEPTTEFCFSLRPIDSMDNHAEAWRQAEPLVKATLSEKKDDWIKQQSEAARTLIDARLEAEQEFSNRPPTAVVRFAEADWEIGTPDEWWCECEVLRSVFFPLAMDVIAGRCSALDITIALSPLFASSYWASPSETVTVGLLRVEPYDHGTARGWTEALQWNVASSRSSGRLPSSSHELAEGSVDGPERSEIRDSRGE